MSSEDKSREQKDAPLGWLQVEPQHFWHGEARIEGNSFGLRQLADALLVAAEKGAAETDTMFSSDGEGYNIEINRTEKPDDFRAPFYTVQVECHDKKAHQQRRAALSSGAAHIPAGCVVVPSEFVAVAKEALEAVRFVIHDAGRTIELVKGEAPKRWLDRLARVELLAREKSAALDAPLPESGRAQDNGGAIGSSGEIAAGGGSDNSPRADQRDAAEEGGKK